jgi:type IV secretory pathway TrbD component
VPSSESGRETHALHAALYRPVLLGGVAPAFLFVEACAVFLLLFEAGLHGTTILLAVLDCAVLHPLARWLSARDPQIVELAVRSLTAGDFYSPLPGLRATVGRALPALPGRS